MSLPKKLTPRAHVDVNDRRLKPIYECLDNGDNKKAIQEAERVLKKAKQMSCAKALKCLALIRLGRKIEARGTLSEVRKVQSIDDGTLQALTACYKELPDFEQIVSMYEESLAFNPNDEATLTQLFNAYVRVGDFHNQQQTAMKLYKLFPSKTPYLFWVIMSYVMMSSKDPNVGKKVYLPLAEVMTSKYLKEAKHESESELMVYMMILEKQKKYKELLDVLKGPMGDEMTQNLKYKTNLLLKTLKNLENWKELNTTYKRLLLENLDDIAWYREYLKYSLVLLHDTPSDASLSALSFHPIVNSNHVKPRIDDVIIEEDKSVESIAAFLNSCVELSSNFEAGYTHRAPYLAQLELIVMVKSESSWADNLASQFLELLVNYFIIFGDKPSCLNDIKKFFDVLTQEEKSKLREMFQKALLESIGDTLPENYKAMHKNIFSFQADHYLGFHDDLPVQEQLDVVESLLELYQHGLKFGENLISTDIQPADPYILLSGEILFNVAMKSNDMQHLTRAISLLESGLEKSPSNHFMKLLLVKYHATSGTMTRGLQTFESLEVKYIQNDTLGYIILNPLMKHGHFQAARKFCDTALKFYDSVQRETTDFIISCYKYGTFDKVNEFVDLKRKVTRSVQYASISVNKLMLGLISSCHDYKAIEEFVLSHDLENLFVQVSDINKMVDNRDFDVISQWKLYGKQQDNFKEESLAEEKAWILVQTAILNVLWGVVKKTNALSTQQNSTTPNDSSIVDISTNDADPAKTSDVKAASVVTSKINVNSMIGYDEIASSDIEGVLDEAAERFSSFSLLDKNGDPTDSLFKILSVAKNCCIQSFGEHFFRSPLSSFVNKKLDESLKQYVEFFNSLVEIVQDPSLDARLPPMREDFIVPQLDDTDLINAPAHPEEYTLLIQHFCHLSIILHCCDTLLQPFKSIKKGKKKSKKPDIKNVASTYDCLMKNLQTMHSSLTKFLTEISLDSSLNDAKVDTNHLRENLMILQQIRFQDL